MRYVHLNIYLLIAHSKIINMDKNKFIIGFYILSIIMFGLLLIASIGWSFHRLKPVPISNFLEGVTENQDIRWPIKKAILDLNDRIEVFNQSNKNYNIVSAIAFFLGIITSFIGLSQLKKI